jgi:hypothetical protein
MRTLLLSLVVIAITTTAAATVLYSTGLEHHPIVKPIVVPDIEYRFYDRFCRAQYNNPTDRNACMMQATGTWLHVPISELDDR